MTGGVSGLEVYLGAVNETAIPLKVMNNLTLTLEENATATIERIDNESRLVIDYPQEVNFINVTEKLIEFGVDIIDFVLEEDTMLKAEFLISNDRNNITSQYILAVNVTAVNVTAYTQPDFIEISQYNITILNGDFIVNITTDLLPMKGNLFYRVRGRPETPYNISCEDHQYIRVCPKTGTFDSTGMSDFNITYYVGMSAPLGSSEASVNISDGNWTRETKIIFVLSEATVEMMTYVFRDECFVSIPGQTYLAVTYDCLMEQEEFNIRRLTHFIERQRALANTSGYCEPEIKTEYIIGGSVNDTIYEELSICRDDRKGLNNLLANVTMKSMDCENRYNEAHAALMNNESECLQSTFAKAVSIKDEAEKAEKRATRRWWLRFFITILLVALAWLVITWLRGHRKQRWSGIPGG